MKFLGYEYDKFSKHFILWVFGIKFQIKDRVGILKTTNEYLINVINKIGVDKIPAAEGELRQWQLENLEILQILDKICKENNLQYWLDFGTLLGAIRHKGFIPWDDDIDISMLNFDLEKIIPILNEKFKGTDYIVRERALQNNNFQVRICHKMYNMGVDIFPVYKYPASDLSPDNKEQITNKIIAARKIFNKKHCAKYMSDMQILKAKKDIIKIQNDYVLPKNTEMPENPILFHGIEFDYLKNEYVMPYDFIFPLREVDFENIKFFAPNKPEEYLSSLWTNWMDMPKISYIFEHYRENYKEHYEN